MLPVDPLASECSTRCVWSSICGDGAWNITTTIAAPKEPCSQPLGSPCDNGQATVWRLNYSQRFNCSIPGKDPDITPLPPGDGGGGGGGGGTPSSPSALQQIESLLQQNPFGILPCNQIEKFLELGRYQAPQSVINRLLTLDQQYSIYNPIFRYHLMGIIDANGKVINCDYFPVKISRLPTINGRQVTASELLAMFRKDINGYINTAKATFEPYKYGSVDDETLWNSANPLGAMLHINMLDDGTVIVTEFNTDRFTVETAYTPKDFEHPVSGNRRWGVTADADGGYTFYTMGVDRITLGLPDLLNKYTNFGFSTADRLWGSLQEKMTAKINENGGAANVVAPTISRPDYKLVKDVIDGTISIETFKQKIGCK
ncbi:MAG TPA: hypothetical protein VM802_16405 [Chitinophaga sp.]|uniref:hypothetical protein n=1 Tax=Chitinophaga sp. TaxID=1869181 RepID=UPI002C158537|nr:hypothetical protein [Chitinophaga sp.]HVI46459.1 hypothetical protein [Chitinophaga sp.]